MLETDASARGVDEDNLPILPLFLKERNIVESYYNVCFGRLAVVFVGLLGKEGKKNVLKGMLIAIFNAQICAPKRRTKLSYYFLYS